MFGGEDFEKELDRGTGRTGGDWRCRGRFSSLEAIKPVGRKTSRRKAVAYWGGQCPPHHRFSDSESVGRLGEGRVNLWVRTAESLWCGNKFAWVRLWVVARTGGV